MVFPKKGRTSLPRTFPKQPKRPVIWLKRILLAVFFMLVSGVLFIKFDTNAAALLADGFLRPFLGDATVLFMEKVFFNSSDVVKRLTTNANSVTEPKYLEQGSTANLPGSRLDLTPIPVQYFKALPDEGVWKNHPLSLFPGQEVMAYTFVRSDPKRPFSMTTIVQLDMHVMSLGSVAGRQQPGGPVGKPGPGVVPQTIQSSGKLIAAFDGGFQYKDGQYGMIVGDTTYLPLKNDLGTLIGYKDGSLKIINYTGESLGSNVAFVRQNCPMLITNGEVSAADPRNKGLWGRLATGTVDIYTWRSGLGLTAKGNLLFAVGNNLTPVTLADALKAAGAVDAIQLDINPIWVRFNIFEPAGSGKYTSSTLIKDLADGSHEYLNGYAKDFFYIFEK